MMNNKYSTSGVTQYSRELAKKLSDAYFTDNAAIIGPELKNFSPVRQINLFLVKELLNRWHAEMEQIRSPYFNFEAEPVKASLAQFMNELSQHIRVERPAFEPLLATAIEHSLLLALDPAAYFEAGFLQKETQTETEKLASYLRYLDSARPLFTEFLDSVHGPLHNRDFLLQRFRLFLNSRPQDQQPSGALMAELEKLHPLTVLEISPAQATNAAAALPPQTAPKPAMPSPEPAVSAPEPPAAPAPVAQPVAEAPKPQASAPEKPGPDLFAASAPAKASPAAAAAAMPDPAAGAPKQALHEKHKTEKPSLNDTLRKPAAPTLADTMGGRKIESLKNSISINQRFAFINELFGGDNQAYHAAIEQLDRQPTLQEARSFVLEDLTQAYAWHNHTEHVNKLLRLVDRKFA